MFMIMFKQIMRIIFKFISLWILSSLPLQVLRYFWYQRNFWQHSGTDVNDIYVQKRLSLQPF